MGRNDPGLLGCTQHHCTSAVAPQHAVAAVVPIGNPRQGLGADDQRGLDLAGSDELIRHRYRINESTTDRLHVKCRTTIGNAQLGLKHARRTGKHPVRGRRGDHNQLNFAGIDTCRIERAFGCFLRQVAGQLAFRSDMTLTNAGAFNDPLAGGFDPFFELGIGQNARRQIAASARDAGIDSGHGRCNLRQANSPSSDMPFGMSLWTPTWSAIRRNRPPRTSSAALRMACSKENTSAEP